MYSTLQKTLALLIAAASTASASLVFDLRATDINNVPVLDPKNVAIKIGDIVTLDLFVTITGAAGNPALEGFQAFFSGSFLTPGGNLDADIVSRSLVPPFDTGTSSLGAIVDLDGDGDLDLGSNITVPNSNHASARSEVMITGDPTGLGPSTFHIYTVDLLINPPPDAGAASTGDAIFRLTDYPSPLSNEVAWQEDGIMKLSRSGAGGTGFAALDPGTPVHLIPEPGAAGLLLLGIGTLGIRRRRVQHCSSAPLPTPFGNASEERNSVSQAGCPRARERRRRLSSSPGSRVTRDASPAHF